MNYLLLCFSCILSIYSPLQTLAWSSEAEKDQPIDDFIDKLLRSDKFDQLASKIAEKAVDRIFKIRSNNVTYTANSDLVYRVGKNESNVLEKKEYNKPTEQTTENSNHVSDEITSLLEKRQPFSKLSLKYVKLIEKKHNENVARTNVEEKSSTKGRAKTNKARVKSDTENDVYGQFNTKGDGKLVKKGKAKLKKVKNVSKPKRKRKTTATTKVTKHDYDEKHFEDSSFESKEPTRFNTTAVLISGEEKYYTHIFAHSDEKTTTKTKSHKKTSIIAKNDYKNMTNVKTKRILARENDRLYVFASSSDYDNLYIEDDNR